MTSTFQKTIRTATVFAAALLLATGCKKTTDNSANYKSAINAWYSAHPACLWSDSQKFPAQVAASNNDQTAPYAALVDQGLLTRTTSEKKIIIISKQEVNYDLSDRAARLDRRPQPARLRQLLLRPSLRLQHPVQHTQQRPARRHHHCQLPVQLLWRSRLGAGSRNPERLPPTEG